ncbi:hypothetical protein C2E21_6403 [Chlorella sorokiniana]|uniref:Uncharacterized protein n=1 Tax=Chlorella sorokiniana TaxID=3076 RepID=A0A2P6TLH6_CHLSO|nr:hypothetical protein C2E21_6403 [Chlorella sorokiniana]|eukprot:PRW45125.1 hypothetical protein C2E21_6403 [Chlorella sorokiniana]
MSSLVCRLPQGTQRPHRRPWQQRCRAAAADGSSGGSGGSGSDDVRARIARAREYKKTAAEQQAPPQQAGAARQVSAATSTAAEPPQASGGDVEAAFSDAAQQLAAKEEAQFLQAVAEASSTASSTAGSAAAAAPAPPSSSRQAGSGHAEAVLARINAARKYKQQPDGSQQAGSGAAIPATSTINASSSGSGSGGAGSTKDTAAQAQQQQQQADEEQQRSFRTGAGGAEQAANWLQFAEGSGAAAAQIDQSLSAEQFTLAKEELIKQQEVEIVTVDAAYAARLRREKAAQQAAARQGGTAAEAAGAAGAEEAAQQGEEGEDYHKPKVATWGVFPRPRNISEAYGGGRNLKPGQALESEEAAAERQARVSAALKEYRKTLGLDVDPAVEADAQAAYNQGVALFEQGLITAALPKFEYAVERMALRSRLGGEARLQQAICLDSLGRNQEAYEIYTKIETHPAPGVAKKAKRMLFGWKAAENLKTNRLSYQPTSAQWKRYFDRINRGSTVYLAPAEEAEAEAAGGGAAVAAAAVAFLPLAFVVYRVLVSQ